MGHTSQLTNFPQHQSLVWLRHPGNNVHARNLSRGPLQLEHHDSDRSQASLLYISRRSHPVTFLDTTPQGAIATETQARSNSSARGEGPRN